MSLTLLHVAALGGEAIEVIDRYIDLSKVGVSILIRG